MSSTISDSNSLQSGTYIFGKTNYISEILRFRSLTEFSFFNQVRPPHQKNCLDQESVEGMLVELEWHVYLVSIC